MFAVVALALALAMDAFAVSLVRGAAAARSVRRAVETGIVFGIVQGAMAWLGWALGIAFAGLIERVDHWIAFVLLAIIGARMVYQGMADGEEDEAASAGNAALGGSYGALLLAAVATSIDATAAGLTLGLFDPPILVSCAIIGLVTAALCIPAHLFAARIGNRLGGKAEIVGGIVLIGLGINILVAHTGIVPAAG
ncbi:hypothetical protein GRI62_01020 [Erythrobacter arachoides]|uniref:Putative manganese efflux pump MntP n=1 Tax=Aurantiacibacter arachoides TaxID=1850444 RepID=A0A844ZZM7_9SPHN|nr:manganese efflux pump MntP family protein [Aurantiacibacter arachoides]MXO92187.1 hypothetical protein [Aurantiacibacter arachoides]GGD58980.1 putative manganese efflux pump MntP [Aurantiacibacter arachoides]